jgi:hypothetical protein
MGSVRRRRSAVAAAALMVTGGIVLAQSVVPASGAGGPYITYINTTYGQNLQTALPDGSGTVTQLLPTGITSYAYDVSADGSALLTWSVAGTETQMANNDASMAIVMTRGTQSRVIGVSPMAPPVLSADGMTAYVYTLAAGYEGLYAYSWADGTLTAITPGSGYESPADPTTPGSTLPLDGYTVSPDGNSWAGTFGYRFPDGTRGATAVAVYSVDVAAPLWTSTELAGSPGTSFQPITWVTPTSFLVDGCKDATCIGGTKHLIDLQPAANPSTPSDTLLPNLDDTYGVAPLNGTWFAWRDSGTGANLVSSYAELSDLTSTPTMWTPRTNGATTGLYKPTASVPVAQVLATGKMRATPTFDIASTHAPQGKGLVYRAFAIYGGDALANAIQRSVRRGALQFSTDSGRTYHTVATTTGGKPVTWPVANQQDGTGTTPKLTRNTFIRWSYPGDAFTQPSISPARLVVVAPHVIAHVKKVGAKRIVSGTAVRSGGRIDVYRGGTRVATSTIKANGQYAFKALVLKKGTYTVIAVADKNWGKGTTSFKV